MNIFVGNLSYEVTDAELRSTFEQYGEVQSASVIMDRTTGRSRGFGFVEMPDKSQGEAAIKALHLQPIKGRNATVNEARPKTDAPRGGGGRGFSGRRRERW